MLAVVLEDFTVCIIDIDTLRVVRVFTGHSNTITDLVMSLFTWLLVSLFFFFLIVIFNYTYYTLAHKCNMWQLFAVPALYENNIALGKPEGRNAHARTLPLFSAAIFSLALYHCAA